MITRQQGRLTLKERRHSYRSAAAVLGCSFTHLAYVMTGARTSQSLLRRILEIPQRESVPPSSKYFGKDKA